MSTDDNALGEMAKGIEARGTAKTEVDGVTSYMAVEDGKLITGTLQDCTPYVEKAKEMHRSGQHGSKEMRLAASIPMVVIETYCNVNGITYEEWGSNPLHLKRMCNDPALADFRIWPGRV